jgi:hypothetical protein
MAIADSASLQASLASSQANELFSGIVPCEIVQVKHAPCLPNPQLWQTGGLVWRHELFMTMPLTLS